MPSKTPGIACVLLCPSWSSTADHKCLTYCSHNVLAGTNRLRSAPPAVSAACHGWQHIPALLCFETWWHEGTEWTHMALEFNTATKDMTIR